jgi:hypothetical protein
MRFLLARFGAVPGADYRAVFNEFAASLARVLHRRGAPKVRAIAG